MLNKAELLLPAGSLVKLKTAVLYGADAVYAGTPDMCLRAQSKFPWKTCRKALILLMLTVKNLPDPQSVYA